MGKIYEKLKTINKLYIKALDSIDTENWEKTEKKELSDYLDKYGLIKRKTPTRANKFLDDLNEELPTLNKRALDNVFNDFVQTLWQLQTGEIINISELIYIEELSFPVHVIEIIEAYKSK
jgi:hypothetical protein